MKPLISVITCSHNPRTDFLERTINSLKQQELALDQWEYLLIDNASSSDLKSTVDLGWHPGGRHIFEETLGLTPARLRGIKEAQGEILVFVDDDNVLNPDYLTSVVNISKSYPFIGAWGGQISPEFEQIPPEWLHSYVSILAIRCFDKDIWTNSSNLFEAVPCGAGLCVQRAVAEKYSEYLLANPLRLKLGRRGALMTACEDSDLAFTAFDMGLGTGQFVALKMTHLIPAYRIQEKYLLKLAEGMAYSQVILSSFRHSVEPITSWKEKLRDFGRRLLMNSRQRRFYNATKRGEKLAFLELLNQTYEQKNS